MKKIILLLMVALISCQSETKTVITPESIVSNYLQATGGIDNLKKAITLIKKGHYVEPAYNLVLNALVRKKRPNLRVIGASGIREGFDGKTAWEYHPGEPTIYSEGEAKKVILISSDFDYPFIDAQQKGHSLTYRGIVEIGGQPTHDLEITIDIMGTKYVSSYYFDTHSHLLVAQRKIMPIHATGPDVDIMLYYGDYREVNGILLPHSFIERRRESGQFLNATILSEVIVNAEIPDSEFSPPVQNE